MIRLKRVYESPSSDDGVRILVDRVWPRGIAKDRIKIDRWLKEIAPSNELRKFFAHESARWPEFVARYRHELQSPANLEMLDELAALARKGTVTLLYGARDTEHNQAVVIREVLARDKAHQPPA